MLKKSLYLFLVLALLCACDSSNLEPSTGNIKTLLQGKTMGTTYHIALVHPETSAIDAELLQISIDDALESLNQQLSTYITSSQVSRFNQSNSTAWIKVDKKLFSIVQAAQGVSKMSEGAFDVSVSPLVNLWGFGVEKRDKVPQPSEIKQAMAQIGYPYLQLNPNLQSLRKTHHKLRIDLSAIAKGFSVDEISDLLKNKGFTNHLVEIGGELRVSGLNQANKKWRVAVEQPDLTSTIAQHGLEITNRAIATSGDYRNYFVAKGVRQSHIINPKTGYPIKHNLASVTVLHESAMLADAYATALMVMGEKQGKIFTTANNLEVLMIIRNADKLEFWSSSKAFR